jgi:zinc finger protein DZIP1
MATQFMPPYDASAAGGPQLGYNMGHQSAYSSKTVNGRSFAFRKRYERIDWRRVASIDVDQVARTLDFNALQDNIMNLTFCNIEAELVSIFKRFSMTICFCLI